jgi:hypothetical protein
VTSRTVFGEIKWGSVRAGGAAHAFDTGEESETSLCGLDGIGRWTSDGVEALAKCRRCIKAQMSPFMPTEDELSAEARAILAYARASGQPFTRFELADVAPGSQWDEYSRWPKTIAGLDPIRELVSAGMVAEHDEVPLKSNPSKSYKRWALTGAVPLLSDLLDAYAEAVLKADETPYSAASGVPVYAERDNVRAEIIRRFGR